MTDWRDVFEAGEQRRKREQADLNAKLGEPAVFVPESEGDTRFGRGYWKGEGGVFSYPKYANGYSPVGRIEYPDSLIDILNKVRQGA